MVASQKRDLFGKENLNAHQIRHHLYALDASIDIITKKEETKVAVRLLKLGCEFVKHGNKIEELAVDVAYDGYVTSSGNHIWLLLSDFEAILNQLEQDFLLEGTVEDKALTDYFVVGLGDVTELQILRVDLGHTKRSVWRPRHLFDHSVSQRIWQSIKNKVCRLHFTCL